MIQNPVGLEPETPGNISQDRGTPMSPTHPTPKGSNNDKVSFQPISQKP